jgi:hypothetical protein
VVLDDHGGVVIQREEEMNESGGETAFDLASVLVVHQEQVERLEQFEIDDVDAAVARYRELTGTAVDR